MDIKLLLILAGINLFVVEVLKKGDFYKPFVVFMSIGTGIITTHIFMRTGSAVDLIAIGSMVGLVSSGGYSVFKQVWAGLKEGGILLAGKLKSK